jgi:SpoVK/Ycf46/Vps4 family AAA+-type ATPase
LENSYCEGEINLDATQCYKLFLLINPKMRESNILDPEVNIELLTELSANYTGAEIAGVVKAASSYALNRHIKVCFPII